MELVRVGVSNSVGRSGAVPCGQDLPQGVDGRAVDMPLCDAHLAQVGACVARQALSVLKELAAELAADFFRTWG